MSEHQQTQKSTESKSTIKKQATPRIQAPISHPMAIIQRARINPKSLTHADVMQLQHTIGNRAVVRLLSEIGAVPSKAKQAPPVQRQELVQRQEIPEEEEPLQGKFESGPTEETYPSCMQRQEIPEEEEPLQGKFESIQRQEIPEEEELLQKKRENNTGMPDNLKAGVENLSGIDMSDVRVHYNSSKPAEVGALAYTQGTDIHVAPGQERHLPHEAWHVVQQAQGRVRPTIQLKENVQINDDAGLEHEADVMGTRAYQMRPADQGTMWSTQQGSQSLQRANETKGEKEVPIEGIWATGRKVPLSFLYAPTDLISSKAFQVMETELVQSSDDVLSNQGIIPAIPTVQRRGVIQLSADETEVEQIAATDRQIALTKMEVSRLKIAAIRAGQELKDEETEDPFADLPQTTGHTVATRRTVPFGINRGNGLEEYRVPVQDLFRIIEICKANSWRYVVHSLPRGYEFGKQGEIIQMAGIAAGYGGGNMNENAPATVIGVAAPNLANGILTFNGITANNTSIGASGTSLNRQPNGAGVGATRPRLWADFIGMIGAINPFRQGHMINQRLGGDGNHDNLAPFTPSLNALHYSRVESHVINQTDAVGRDEYADYSVTPIYGGNPGIVAWALAQFAAMTPDNQRIAMVTAGIMTAAASAAYAPGTPLIPADLGNAHLWITNYINNTFPTNIVCWADFINAVGGGTYNSTPRQTVTITNDF